MVCNWQLSSIVVPKNGSADESGCPTERDDLQSVLQPAVLRFERGLMVYSSIVDLSQLVLSPESEPVSAELYPWWLKVNVLVEWSKIHQVEAAFGKFIGLPSGVGSVCCNTPLLSSIFCKMFEKYGRKCSTK